MDYDKLITQYNEAEAIAIENSPELYKIMNWEAVYAPGSHAVRIKMRIDNSRDIFYHLNRFSEYDDISTTFGHWFLNETGGFNDKDIKEFVKAGKFITKLSPNIPLPIDSLLGAWAVTQKILAANPEPKNILEIGPGAGLTSIFFNNIKSLSNYTQIEATQSLYLCQAAINDALGTENKTFWHIPWWKLNWLKDADIKYDIITANACLCEMTQEALLLYSNIFAKKAADNCIFIIQGPGLEYPNTRENMLNTFKEFGWHIINTETDGEREGPYTNIVINWWLNRTGNPINRLVKIPLNYSKEDLINLIKD